MYKLEVTLLDFYGMLPMLILAVGGMALMLIDLVLKPQHKSLGAWLAVLSFVGAGAASYALLGQQAVIFSGMLVIDSYAQVLGLVAIGAGALTVLTSINYLRDRNIARNEYYVLLLFSVSGMVMMAAAHNLIIIFIALELLSIPLYILSGFARPDTASEEAALKYFLLGAFASGFLLFGVALTYGALGTTDLALIATKVAGGNVSPLLLFGAALVLVGLGFKVAVVPFHMWTPDVYEGAPTPVAGFMSVGAKVAGFAALLRVFVYALGPLQADWVVIVSIIAAITMILGSIVAIAQTNLKRLLAYSSIATAGYILIGVAAGNETGVYGALFYLIAYLFTNLGAFAVLTAMARQSGEDQTYQAYRGLYQRSPGLAIMMMIFMLSLAGIPLTGGFIGKYLLFVAALEAGLNGLAIIAVATSVIAAFFYLRVIVDMFMRDAEPGHEVQPVRYRTLSFAVGLSALAVLLLGILPNMVLTLVQNAAQWLIAGAG
ncbi:MAG TPA: NADH-quinone oxidoreductase subunit N [Anaerolineae bacterium]|nr:NADH-quinone oxidoreductase subunit N [Anaerolineae bacterium]